MTGSASFYRAHLFFCTHRRPPDHPRSDCTEHGSEALALYLKARIKERGLKRVRVNTADCLHRCSLGPVLVIYPEAIWYTFSTATDIDDILETHLIQNNRVARLLLPERPTDAEEAS